MKDKIGVRLNEEEVLDLLVNVKIFRMLIYRADFKTFLSILDLAGYQKPSEMYSNTCFENGVIVMYQCDSVLQIGEKSIAISSYSYSKNLNPDAQKRFGEIRFFHPNGKLFEVPL